MWKEIRWYAFSLIIALVYVYYVAVIAEWDKARRHLDVLSSIRSVESLNNAEARATTERSDEFRTNGGLGTGRKDPADEATVPPTAGEILAQWLADDEALLQRINDRDGDFVNGFRLAKERDVHRFRAYLDAKDETR